MWSPVDMQRSARCRLAADAASVLSRACDGASTRERCGVLLGRRTDARTWLVATAGELANQDERPARFLLDPGAIVASERRASEHGLDLLGFFHTHSDLDPRPSAADRVGAWADHLVLVVTRNGSRAFLPRAGGFVELECSVVRP